MKNLTSQKDEKLPYSQILEYPEEYNAGTVVSRMLDGLGFRFYWATEGLRPEDLSFKPSDEARTSEQTIDHILELSEIILNSLLKLPNTKIQRSEIIFSEKRKKILKNIEKASTILRKTTNVSEFKIIFGKNEFPFWNNLNGPIADSLWHIGQITSFRRTSGNPLPKGVLMFMGRVKQSE